MSNSISSVSSLLTQTQKMPSNEEMFNKLDQNGDGKLDQDELASVVDKINETQGLSVDVVELLSQNDTDGDGALNQDEMDSAMESYAPPQGPPPQMLNGVAGYGELTDASEMFSALDTDGDGKLSTDELSTLAQQISQNSSLAVDVESLMAEFDADEDGALNEDETMSFLESLKEQTGEAAAPPPPPPPAATEDEEEEDETSKVFSRIDTNGDGKIDAEELAAFAKKVGKISGETLNVDDLLAQYDSDQDGLLSQEEATSMIESLKPEKPEGSANQTSVQNTNAITKYLSILTSNEEDGGKVNFEI